MQALPTKGKHRVLAVSDFFFPAVGGVESHIYHLSHCLVQQGHKVQACLPLHSTHAPLQHSSKRALQVVVLTHAQGDRTGVRWLSNGIKVCLASPRL